MSLVQLAAVCSHLQNASLARLGLTSIPYSKLHLSFALLLQKQGFFSQVKLGGRAPPYSCFNDGLREQYQASNQPAPEKVPKTYEELVKEGLLSRLQTHILQLRAAQEKDVENDEEGEQPQTQKELRVRPSLRPAFEETQDTPLTDLASYQYSSESLRQFAGPAAFHPNKVEQTTSLDVMGLTVEDVPVTQRDRRLYDPLQLDAEGVVTQANIASRRLWLGLKYYDSKPVLSKARLISKPTKRIWLNTQELSGVIRGRAAGEVKGLSQIGEVMVVSTDRGLMEARECVERRIGGQPLVRVW